MKALLVVAALAASAAPALAQDGTLQIYSAYPDEHMKALIDSFAEKHPDVEVQVSVQPGEQLLSTIELEMRAGSPQADVVGLNQASIGYLQRQHTAFAQYVPQGADGVRPEVRDPANVSAPACVNLYLIQYNTNAISKEDAPKSWADLTDPRFKDQIAMADPGSSQSVHSFLWFASSYLGEDKGFGWPYFEKLAANAPRLERSHGTIRDLTAAGERPIGIQLLANAQTSANRGDPTSIAWPTEGSPGEVSSFAMFAASDNKPAAGAWLDHIVSPEAQALMPNALGCAPVRTDVDYRFPDGTAVADVTIVPVDSEKIGAERKAQTEAFNKAFGG